MTNARRWFSAVAAVPLLACAGDDRDMGGGSGVSVSASASETGGADGGPGTGASGSGSGSGSGGGSGPLFDVGGESGGGPGDGMTVRCEKVDFLFVVDASPSMLGEQQNLINSFPKFIDSIRTSARLDDYNIMVVDTDECVANRAAGQSINLNDASADQIAACCATFPNAVCENTQCAGCPADPCEANLGMGRRTNGSGSDCGIDGSARFMTHAQSDPETTFACLGNLGGRGSGDERPMQASVEAISEANTGPGGCNEGFLRDDALLVIVVISDEEDHAENFSIGLGGSFPFGSEGDPTSWHNAIVQRKGGNDNNVVVVSLIGPRAPDSCPPPGANHSGAEVADRIVAFTKSFNFGFIGQVCAADYNPIFQEAVSVIDSACDEFTPPG